MGDSTKHSDSLHATPFLVGQSYLWEKTDMGRWWNSDI